MTDRDKIRELERKIEELEAEKEKQDTKRSGFLTTAGILTIIASCLTIIFGILFIIEGIEGLINYTINNYYYNLISTVTILIAGTIGILAFSFGLSAGTLTLKRNNKKFAIFGVSFLLASSFVMPFLTTLSYIFFLIPIAILSILSLIFLGVANNNFKTTVLKIDERELELEYPQPAPMRIEHKTPFEVYLVTAILAVGIVVTVIGIFFSYYPGYVISGIQEKLSAGSLSQSEIWMYSGSLTWWNNQQITVYQPISIFLIIAGSITLFAALIGVVLDLSLGHIRANNSRNVILKQKKQIELSEKDRSEREKTIVPSNVENTITSPSAEKSTSKISEQNNGFEEALAHAEELKDKAL
jgi:hypothetical protein